MGAQAVESATVGITYSNAGARGLEPTHRRDLAIPVAKIPATLSILETVRGSGPEHVSVRQRSRCKSRVPEGSTATAAGS